MTRFAAATVLLFTTIVQACSNRADAHREPAPPCRPVDSAWAIQVHATDAQTHHAVANVSIETVLRSVETDSAGWACLRDFAQPRETLDVQRRGYEPESVSVAGSTGSVIRREIVMKRVPAPCCDLRGRWKIVMQLDSPAAMYPKPRARRTSGEVALGPRVLPMQAGDDLDSLVHIVRGLHRVDFTPFFGGQVAPDVSRSIFGSGPDLLHEVVASVTSGDEVEMTFVPRMTHGSISFEGRVRGDSVRGTWVQNAYCCGARGHFEMVRVERTDTTAVNAPPSPRYPVEREGAAARNAPTSGIPIGRWRPQLAIAPNGALWFAPGGLFVADSLHGVWRRALGSDADPVAARELRLGIAIAFVDSRTVLVGLRSRYPMEHAPVVYRTEDTGAHWTAVAIPNVQAVQALDAIDASVWLVPQDIADAQTRIMTSSDGGTTWREQSTPPRMVDATYLFRESKDTAYIATSVHAGGAALWRTVDGGLHWTALPTPHDQGLQHVPEGYVRVQELATIGRWLVVKELAKVYARRIDEERWHPLAGIEHIASERGGRSLFVITDSLRPVLLDSALRPTWRAPTTIPSELRNDIEQVLMHKGNGYVSFTHGNVLETGPAIGMSWLTPEPPSSPRPRADTVRLLIPRAPTP